MVRTSGTVLLRRAELVDLLLVYEILVLIPASEEEKRLTPLLVYVLHSYKRIMRMANEKWRVEKVFETGFLAWRDFVYFTHTVQA